MILKRYNDKTFSKGLIIFIVLQFLFFKVVFAQNNTTKDSLKIERLTKGMHNFYQNPLKYKKNLPIALNIVDSLLLQEPSNHYLLQKKSKIMHYAYYFVKRNFNDSITLNYIQEAKYIREKIKDTCGLEVVYRQLSGFWKAKKSYTKAEIYATKAYDMAKSCQDSMAMNLGALSKIQATYLKNRKKKSVQNMSLEKLKVILDKALKKQEYRTILIASDHIIDIYLYKRQYDSIGHYLKLAEVACLKRDDKIKLKSLYRKLGTYYKRGRKDINKALPYYKKSVLLNEQLQDSLGLIKAYLGLSNTLKDLGQYKKALITYKKYVKLEKKAVNTKNYHKLADIEASYLYKQQKKIDSLKTAQLQKEKNLALKVKTNKKIWSLIVSLLSFLIIAVILYFKYKRKLLLKEIDNLKLQKKVKTKTGQVDSLLKESIKYIEQKKHLTKDLKKLSRTNDNTSLSSILSTLRSDTIEDSKLLTLREDLEKNSFDFTSRLKEEYPNLTKGDLELCALLRLDIPRKEIAIIRGTTEDSLKTARSRVRKKLNLQREVLLNDFVSKY